MKPLFPWPRIVETVKQPNDIGLSELQVLYDLDRDPSESNDVTSESPKRFEAHEHAIAAVGQCRGKGPSVATIRE